MPPSPEFQPGGGAAGVVMPNHVTSTCTVVGPAEDIARFNATHFKARTDGQPKCLDFQSVIPAPGYMSRTHSGSGEKDLLKHPANGRALSETGHLNWYEWNTANWGTKWGAYAFERIDDASFSFETAWSFPTPIFRRLAADWPTLRFDVECFDEGWCFAGMGQFNGLDNYVEVSSPQETPEILALYERVYGHAYECEE